MESMENKEMTNLQWESFLILLIELVRDLPKEKVIEYLEKIRSELKK